MMTILLFVFVTLAGFLQLAQSLTCLQCDNAIQPRHCKYVAECSNGEVCGTEKIKNSFGDDFYNVGCMRTSDCTNTTNQCTECCSSDICNANGCGEQGYPSNIRRICYNCAMHSNAKGCHKIEFCSSGEVCMFDTHKEFGDLVYSSTCSTSYTCRNENIDVHTIVGRDVEYDTGLVDVYAKRSMAEHVCRGCCTDDLCNTKCNGSDTATPKPRFCHSDSCMHGKCYESTNDYVCVCNHGFEGKQCNTSTIHCQSNSCYHGQCYEGLSDYVCACDSGYKGKQCNASTSHCQSNPCVHGPCYEIPGNYVCKCNHGFEGRQCNISTVIARDCGDILQMNSSATSGLYHITLWNSKAVRTVWCDMDTDTGGWTVFQRRVNGSVDFYRNYSTYENGFGHVAGEFWLGLASIYEMAAMGISELRLDLTSANGGTAYEVFQHFSLDPSPKYTLHIDTGTGTAGDGHYGLSYSNGQDFFTYDRDTTYNCALSDRGGWWYRTCAYANINGYYATPGTINIHRSEAGMIYYDYQKYLSLKESKMMFRRARI